ncbi:MAG TPA: glycosyltransferase [Steroidobacteraceae bacterium]|jgi:glycosyltransferase involved in cell wall biosynthesis
MAFKVANVICRFNSSSGGPPRTVSLIARAGVGHWQAELFTTNFIESPEDSLLVGEFPGHVIVLDRGAQRPYGALVRALGFSRAIRVQLTHGSKPNVVHLHGLWNPLLTAYARAAMDSGIPYIVAPHGMLEPWSLTIHATRKRIALKTYQGSILSRAAAIHTTSDAEAEHVRRLGITGVPIFVVPNAIDEPPNRPDRGAMPVAGGRPILLFLSRVHEKKGLDNLLRAWNELQPAAWDLKIVGHGEAFYVDHLKRLCREKRIPNVHFHPHVDGDQRETMFESASAFVLPTFSENFGNAVAEAMVRGLPVITTKGTPWSVIRERNLGWYIEPTCEQLIVALRELFQADPQSLREMGERARQYAQDNLLVSSVRSRLLEMYTNSLRH